MAADASPGPNECYCTACGAVIKQAAELCPECGVANENQQTGTTSKKYCTTCGFELHTKAERCPECGVPQETSGPKNRKLGRWILGSFLIYVGIQILGGFAGSPLISLVFGLGLFGLGVGSLPPVRNHFERTGSLTTFGVNSGVRTREVSGYHGRCTSCHDQVINGSRREWGKEYVAFGIPLYMATEGSNVYCQTCATGEQVSVADPTGLDALDVDQQPENASETAED